MKEWLEGLQQDKVEDFVIEQSIDSTVIEIIRLMDSPPRASFIQTLGSGPRVTYIGIEAMATWSADIPPKIDIRIHKFTVWSQISFGKVLTHVTNEWRNIDNDPPETFSKLCAGLRLMTACEIAKNFEDIDERSFTLN